MSGQRKDLLVDAETRDRQRRATDPDASAWVTANAGSGKTYVLSRRVLRLLLAGADPAAVLCLTFTKAAAAQMATRVFEELAVWARANDADLDKALSDLLGRSADAAERVRARRLFARAIETPGRLKIQTIHAFCESVLQRFAFEAHVPSGFRVLDDDMANALKTRAREDMLANPESEELGEALGRLGLLLNPRDFAAILAAMTDKRHYLGEWTGNAGRISPGAVRRHVAQSLGIDEMRRAEAIAGDILDGPNLPRSEWASIAAALEEYPGASTNVTTRQLRLAAGAGNAADALEALVPIFWDKGKKRPRGRLLNADAKKAEPGLDLRIEAERDRFLALLDSYRAALLLDANVDLAHAADAVIARYSHFKAERGMLDYADLIAGTVELLEHGSNAAWVLYKLDPGIDHILVDEAQDTSPDQWRVVRALTEEFFAGAGARKAGRTVFAVGDPKQSIYSFQGADPAGFVAMRHHFAKQAGEDYALSPVNLYLSFRTAPAVLEAVDDVFAGESARRGLVFDGDPVSHRAARAQAAGRVEVWDTVAPPDEDGNDPWDAPLDAPRSKAAETVLSERIAHAIRTSIDSGEILPSTRQPAQAGDFLVLLRTRKRLATPVIRALKAQGIPVAGADRLRLTDSIATLDLMALIRASLMPDDDYALACVLKSPLFGLDDEDLMQLAIARPGSLADALAGHRGAPRIEAAAQRYAAWAALARRERPFTFLAHVLGPGGGRRAYRERMGNEADDVLDEIADRAMAFEQSNVASVSTFLAWLERSGGEIKRDLDEGGGAVRVMTVHGAKGLEAPVVFIADTCSAPTGNRRDSVLVVPGSDIFSPPEAVVWLPSTGFATRETKAFRERLDAAGEEEFHRLLYVAMTRAKDRLVICGAETKKTRHAGCWYNLVEAGLAARLEREDDGPRVYRPPTPGEPPQAEDTGTTAAQAEPLPAWAHEAMQARPAPARLAASRIGATRGGGSAGGAQARSRGTLVHRLLELLPDVPATARRKAAEALVARNAGQSTGEAGLVEAVLALLQAPATSELFGPGSRGEVPVAGRVVRIADGEIIDISGRIDRLVVRDGHIVIADYKTGGTPPATPEETPPAYVAQLAAYAALLAAMHPDAEVSARLVWTDADGGPVVTILPPTLLGGFKVAPAAVPVH
ncbi:MAG: double-strand break repair helicase AddA [Rhodobiaceae bacterium]|nr:double-strand break repair helicase AddA [Rhodobiaceae bacterium]